jgi:glutamate dehydrogenase/leucine dehydrogenase
MIPITTFAGKKVAVFGLGESGLNAASALFAGGADVVGWDDSDARIEKATSAGIPTADLRHRGAGARARRAAHPSGAALVGRARSRHGGPGDRRYRAVLP